MKITVKGHTTTEMEHGTVLVLTWNCDLSWRKDTEMMEEKFNTKFYGVSRVMRFLTKKGRKNYLREYY